MKARGRTNVKRASAAALVMVLSTVVLFLGFDSNSDASSPAAYCIGAYSPNYRCDTDYLYGVTRSVAINTVGSSGFNLCAGAEDYTRHDYYEFHCAPGYAYHDYSGTCLRGAVLNGDHGQSMEGILYFVSQCV
jgi:hypothetical protein